MVEETIEKVIDKVNEGDEVSVKVLERDGRGKVRLSIKAVLADEATDEDNSED